MSYEGPPARYPVTPTFRTWTTRSTFIAPPTAITSFTFRRVSTRFSFLLISRYTYSLLSYNFQTPTNFGHTTAMLSFTFQRVSTSFSFLFKSYMNVLNEYINAK